MAALLGFLSEFLPHMLQGKGSLYSALLTGGLLLGIGFAHPPSPQRIEDEPPHKYVEYDCPPFYYSADYAALFTICQYNGLGFPCHIRHYFTRIQQTQPAAVDNGSIHYHADLGMDICT